MVRATSKILTPKEVKIQELDAKIKAAEKEAKVTQRAADKAYAVLDKLLAKRAKQTKPVVESAVTSQQAAAA